MRMRVSMLIAAMMAWGLLSAVAQLRLENRSQNVDESTADIYNERFSFSNALSCTKQIDRALRSFTTMTKLAKPKLTSTQMRQVGNTNPDTQHLGFVNWVGAVEGALRKQNYQIAKLQLDIAKMQFEDRKLSAKALQKSQDACRKAEKDFQRFWDSFSIAD